MIKALIETLIMICIPTIFSVLIGIPFGSILYLKNNKILYKIVNIYVNCVRSCPYLIFIILIIPFTRFVFGTAFGVIPASFPICFVGVALYSRFVEQSFYEVHPSIIDYAKSIKVNDYQLVRYFLIRESIQSLVLGLSSTIISIISYSSVMGIVGGGGIGDYAMRYGYYEYNYYIIYKMIFIIAILVFIIQTTGNIIAKNLDKKRGKNV